MCRIRQANCKQTSDVAERPFQSGDKSPHSKWAGKRSGGLTRWGFLQRARAFAIRPANGVPLAKTRLASAMARDLR
jgi:hypothetical protein